MKKNYYTTAFNERLGDIKNTWKLINSVISKSSNLKKPDFDYFTIQGQKITDKKLIANSFNDYFTNLGIELEKLIKPVNNSPTDYMKNPAVNSLYLYPTDTGEIINIVNNIKISNSLGLDGIAIKILKVSITPVAPILSRLINLAFDTGIFPNDLKIAKVCPIYKNNDRHDIKNYRPISVLPAISKIFEKALAIRIENYMNKYNLVSKTQYGFRKGYSSYMAIMEMYNNVAYALDKNEFALGVFLDLSKAFDTVTTLSL